MQRSGQGSESVKWLYMLACIWFVVLAAWPFADRDTLQFVCIFLAGMYANDFERSRKS
jgi:hypothetical protein